MTTKPPTHDSLTIEPIGYVRTTLATKTEAVRQPRAGGTANGRIELLPGRNFEHALLDLDGWDYIWVIFWFHFNQGWRPKVLPPRSRSGRKGVFATRSPHRPNPLGISAVKLERIEGLTLHVADIDILDGTPVFDIKPYVAYTDAIAATESGWLDDNGDPGPRFAVEWDTAAADQAAWIERRTGLPIRERVSSTLSLGPEPQPSRRIRREADGYVLAVKEWRVRFSVAGDLVRVHAIASGFREAQLARGEAPEIAAHREFRALFA